MSSDFWWGMFCIPLAALAVAMVVMAGTALIYASERWAISEYKLWPKRWAEQDRLAAIVAYARGVRYLWIPGWHILICRTTNWQRLTKAEWTQQQRLQFTIRNALAVPVDQVVTDSDDE